MALITISRQLGSLGNDIADALKNELSYAYLDKIQLEEMLVSTYGLPEESVEKYDEKKPAFWDIFFSEKDRYLHFMKTAMYEFAQQGNGIILGRGGQVLLKDVPGALHVRVVAPMELRLERVKQRYNCDDRLAEQLIRNSDHDRIGFQKFFFHINWEDLSQYDLVMNTGTFTVVQVVEFVKSAIEMLDLKRKQEDCAKKLADLCLGQAVVTQIAYKEKLPIQFLEALVDHGVVTLRGSTITADDIQRCEQIAKTVPGVKHVVNEVYFIPNTFGMA